MLEAVNSSTRLGFGAPSRNEGSSERTGNSTALGFPANGLSGSLDGSSSRRQISGAFDENPHQTMIGLGPVMAGSGYGGSREVQKYAQTTIAGMPGIAFEALRQQGNAAQDALKTPARGLSPVSQRLEDPTPVPCAAFSMNDGMCAPNSADNPEDPFSGLPGVAPKPSSLVDEEFVDLTSKLFGEDFTVNAVSGNLEDDDGWDFDVNAGGQGKTGGIGISDELFAVARDVQPEPAQSLKKECVAPVVEPAKKTIAPAPEKPVSVQAEPPKPVTVRPVPAPASSDGSVSVTIFMILGAICLMGWFVIAAMKAGSAILPALVLAALCLVADMAYIIKLRAARFRAAGFMALFAGIIFMVAAMIIAAGQMPGKIIFIIALVFHLIGNAVCLLKK